MRGTSLLVVSVLAIVFLAGCSSNPDDDGDGLSNAAERAGWDVTVDYVGHRVRYHVTSDPDVRDTDGDGVSDQQELLFLPALDPRKADTDDDGLSDCQELLDTNLSHCQDPSYSGPRDGGYGTQPGNADSEPGGDYYDTYSPYKDDTGTVESVTWGDGLSDGMEISGYDVTLPGGAAIHVTSDPRKSDSDGDHLADGAEALVFHTNPLNPDTDGDGCHDGFDPVPERNEHYDLGLTSFTLLKDQATVGGASVQLLLLDYFTTKYVPSESGTFSAQKGRAVDLTGYNSAYGKGDYCTGMRGIPPSRPLQAIQITALHKDATSSRFLDLASQTHPTDDGSATVHVTWNLRTGRFSWNTDGSNDFAGPLDLKGTDGELVLAPKVV